MLVKHTNRTFVVGRVLPRTCILSLGLIRSYVCGKAHYLMAFLFSPTHFRAHLNRDDLVGIAINGAYSFASLKVCYNSWWSFLWIYIILFILCIFRLLLLQLLLLVFRICRVSIVIQIVLGLLVLVLLISILALSARLFLSLKRRWTRRVGLIFVLLLNFWLHYNLIL